MKDVFEKALEVATRQYEQHAFEEDTLAAQIAELSERRRVANALRGHWSSLMAALRLAVSDSENEGGAS